jgi:hypothetical protein
MANFMTAVELRDQLDTIIAKNPNAKLVAEVDGQDDHVVIDGLNMELDSDGDAYFTLRSYGTGHKVSITEIEEDKYQND